jgi:peptide/nickel transport system permease protein
MTATQSIGLVSQLRQRSVLRTLRRFVVPAISLGILAIVVALVALAEVIAPYGPLQQDLARTLEPPSAEHWLGTDALGRDILSRMLFGGQPALLGAALALVIFLALGIALGILAGFLGGWVDRIVGVVVDMFMALPGLVIILAVLAVFKQSAFAAMVVLGILASGTLIRVVRGAVLAVKNELYVDAAVVSGLSDLRIMARHIVPGVVGPVLVQASIFCGVALSVQTGLGFLGVADPPPKPSWGGMIAESAQVLASASYFLLFAGGIVVLLTFAFGFIGDGLRDLAAETRKQPPAPLFRRASRVGSEVQPPTDAATALLAVDDYSIGFDTGDEVTETVSSLTWSIDEGEILGLVGESGSGKTVTALGLLGLLPSNGLVTSGTVWLRGERISGLSETDFARIRGSEIALVSQEPMVALDPSFTIGSQLLEVLKVHERMPRRQLRERAIELLQQVQLRDADDVLRKFPHELSGGMIQRVAIAVALAGRPRLLIADEPTTALDVTVQAEILDLLRTLRDETGMAIILVTHDLGVVADLCDRVLIMSQGRIVERGSVDDIFYNPADEYTKKLLRSTPSLVKRSA